MKISFVPAVGGTSPIFLFRQVNACPTRFENFTLQSVTLSWLFHAVLWTLELVRLCCSVGHQVVVRQFSWERGEHPPLFRAILACLVKELTQPSEREALCYLLAYPSQK